jgi:hypothetical protein
LGLNALTLGALGSSATLASTLLASVNWTLWDGGAARAQVQAQQAALEQAQASYRGVVLTALKDVEDALVALRGDRERATRLQQAATAATQAARLARQRYDSGLVDFQTVLDTQRNQLSTQDSLARPRPMSAPTMCACTRPWAAAGCRTSCQRRPPPPNPVPSCHEHPRSQEHITPCGPGSGPGRTRRPGRPAG